MASAFNDFNIDDPDLPQAIDDAAMLSGGYPYSQGLKDSYYEDRLKDLQLQLVRLQGHLLETGQRVAIVFEGRDAAGKGGAISTYREHLNPRFVISVALPKPNDREMTQWYFQRYVHWLPAARETVLFDRSWYNRAGVEAVMGFATSGQTEQFLRQVPRFEQMITDDGIRLFKFYLDIGREMQMKRFHERRHDPLKRWKISDIDYKALDLWNDYSRARDNMLATTSTQEAPWTVILANSKERARLAVIQTVLSSIDYVDKDQTAIGEIDGQIVMSAEKFLERSQRD